MNVEQQSLALALYDKDSYDIAAKIIDPKTDLSGIGRALLKYITKYYEKDPTATHVDKDILLDHIKLKEKGNQHLDLYVEVLNKLKEPSSKNVLEVLLGLKMATCASEISAKMEAGQYDQAMPWIEDFIKYKTHETEVLYDEEELPTFQDTPLEDIVAKITGEGNTFTLLPKSLDQALDGNVVRGNHIGIFANPDTGKTMFSINMVAGLIRRGHKVLYISNEDAAETMMVRIASRIAQKPTPWVKENPKEAYEMVKEKGYGNLIFKPVAGGTIAEIEDLVNAHRPDVLIVDQIRNLTLPGREGLTSILEGASIEMRRFAKQYHLLSISLTQAGANAKNVLVLDDSHVDSSKVGFVAQLDLLIGIGINDEFRDNNRRMISLKGKNKISGKHIYFPVQVDEITCMVRSLEA